MTNLKFQIIPKNSHELNFLKSCRDWLIYWRLRLLPTGSHLLNCWTTNHICHFFSTGTIFYYIFLHIIVRKSEKPIMRQNSVNRQKKTNLATKQCKMQQNTINCTHNKGDFRFLYICHVKKFEINPNVEKF